MTLFCTYLAPVALCSAALVSIVSCASPRPPVSPRAPDVWPTGTWPIAAPETQGLDSQVLAEVVETLSRSDSSAHSVLVVRHGVLVLEAYFYPYDGRTPHDVASVTKSVTTTLLGISPNGVRGYAAALRGAWIDSSSFEIDYVEPAGSNRFEMVLKIDGVRLDVTVRDRTGLYGTHELTARVLD